MNDWKFEKLGNITHKIGSGATPRGGKQVYKEFGIPIIRSQNIYNDNFEYSGLAYLSDKSANELNNVIVQKYDNLINITGDSVCRTNIVPMELVNSRVNQHVMIIRPNQDVLNYQYLHYFLISPATQNFLLSLADSGGTRKALTKEMICDFEIPLPSLLTQEKIADILGSLDDKIELNRQMNQTLEAMARAIFKSWFVDFDPVYAKMEGHDYPLPPEIMDLFPGEFEESELGLIPKGWRVSEVNELVNRISVAKRYRKELALESGKIPIYEQGNNLLMGFHNDEPDLFAHIDKPYFIFGDHTCVMELIIEPFSLGPNVIPLEGKNVPTIWAYYSTLRKQKFEEYRRHWMELIIKKTIISDNNSILNSFVDSVNPIIQKININKNQIFNLEIIKKLLLPKLMSGELEM